MPPIPPVPCPSSPRADHDPDHHSGPVAERSLRPDCRRIHHDLLRRPGAQPCLWRLHHAGRLHVLPGRPGLAPAEARRVCLRRCRRRRVCRRHLPDPGQAARKRSGRRRDLDAHPSRRHAGAHHPRLWRRFAHHVAAGKRCLARRGRRRHIQHRACDRCELGDPRRSHVVRAQDPSGPRHPGCFHGPQGRRGVGHRSAPYLHDHLGHLRRPGRGRWRLLCHLHPARSRHVGGAADHRGSPSLSSAASARSSAA